MNRTARLAALAALPAAITLGCRDVSTPTAPLRPYELNSSSAVLFNVKINAFVFVVLQCGGTFEEFDTQGKLHILIASETDADGGTHFKLHFQSATLTGTNAKTGEEIRFHVATNNEVNGRLDGARETTTTSTGTATIGEGPDARHWLAHATIHVTMNANGELTATVTEIRMECR